MSLLRPSLRAARRSTRALNAGAPAKPKPLKKGDHLYLIDGSGYLFRAYHALPPLSRKSDGLPTNAVSGYCNMLRKLLDTMKNKRIGSAEVMERFGVPPAKVVEVQALAGDSTDNVPGVRGIGVKTAAELINQYGDLETLLARAGEIKQPKRRETLIENAENARISKRLVTLDQNVPVVEQVGSFAVQTPRASDLIGFLKAMEF